VTAGVVAGIYFWVVLSWRLGKRVVLRYREHRGLVRSCFGETSYFVTGVRVAE
jgi:hypothetical protein